MDDATKQKLREQAAEMVDALGESARAEMSGDDALAEYHGRKVDKLVAQNTHLLDQALAEDRDAS